MIPSRYFLHARPLLPNSSISGLAEAFNKDPDAFFFRRSAQRRAIFYTRQLGIPVTFTILHRDDRP